MQRGSTMKAFVEINDKRAELKATAKDKLPRTNRWFSVEKSEALLDVRCLAS